MLGLPRRFAAVAGLLVYVCVLFLPPSTSYARYVQSGKKGKHAEDPSKVLVINGRSVHNAGELQMHLLNWGEWGSRPDTGEPYSLSPSAQWPAGSGA